jgi:AcrR family transcriptional regulator
MFYMSVESPASRGRILESARQEILASGVIGLRVSAVAKSAKTSIPLIYKYFGDRDGLLTEVLGQIYLEFTAEDITNSKMWLVKNAGKSLSGPEIIDLFPNPFGEHIRERRLWIARIVAASLDLPKLRHKLEEIHEEVDQEFDEVIVEIHSLIEDRKHLSPQVLRSVFRGLSFGHIFTEFNYDNRPTDHEWRELIIFLLKNT